LLSGTSVTFTPASGGTPVSALMYYTLATQVAGMLPSSTPAGAYDVKVTYDGQTSAASRVNVVERNFGFATQSSNGQGPAQATYGGYDGQLHPAGEHPAAVAGGVGRCYHPIVRAALPVRGARWEHWSGDFQRAADRGRGDRPGALGFEIVFSKTTGFN